MSRLKVATALLALLVCGGCARLGFSNRVVHRVPSPDGQFLAVCQEVPAFDGPDYTVRLERPDGSHVRPLYGIGDGDPCHEVAWSPDGKRLAVMSAHVARVVLVDVEAALRKPPTEGLWPRSISLVWPGGMARNLAFAGPEVLEFEACNATPISERRPQCDGGYQRRRLDISTTPARGVPIPGTVAGARAP